MTGTTRPAIRPITKSKPLTRDEQNAGIDDGRHYETPKISPSAIMAIATVDRLRVAPSVGEVAQRLLVYGEEAHGCAVFGRHIGERGPIGQAQLAQTGTEILDEFADDALLAQHFGRSQHEVGSGGPSGSAPVSLKPTTSGMSM